MGVDIKAAFQGGDNLMGYGVGTEMYVNNIMPYVIILLIRSISAALVVN